MAEQTDTHWYSGTAQ